MDIIDNTQTAGIAFDAALMDGGQYYQSASTTDPIKYLEAGSYSNDLLTLKLSSAYGTIVYANTASTPIKLCTATLSPGGDTYGPTASDGNYYFTGVDDGSYTVQTTSTNVWGGCTTVDAGLAKRVALGLPQPGPGSPPFTAIQTLAADANGAGGVTTIDAGFIKRRALGLTVTPSMWAGDNYVFETPTINVSAGLGNATYKGLCRGDVNGSYIVP
jgi:hypothetical protein